MTNSRRDILKFFGIGAAIVPVINGAPAREHEALIVRPPEVTLVERPNLVTTLDGMDVLERMFREQKLVDTMVFLREKDGTTIRFDVAAFISDVRQDLIDVSDLRSSGYREFITAGTITMKLKLQATGVPVMVELSREG